MSEKKKLKPCPFCGGAAVVSEELSEWIVECNPLNSCRVHPFTNYRGNREDAVAEWNEMPPTWAGMNEGGESR